MNLRNEVYIFFRFASILLLWFHGYRSLFMRFIFVKNPSLNILSVWAGAPTTVFCKYLFGETKTA